MYPILTCSRFSTTCPPPWTRRPSRRPTSRWWETRTASSGEQHCAVQHSLETFWMTYPILRRVVCVIYIQKRVFYVVILKVHPPSRGSHNTGCSSNSSCHVAGPPSSSRTTSWAWPPRGRSSMSSSLSSGRTIEASDTSRSWWEAQKYFSVKQKQIFKIRKMNNI